MHNTMPGQTLFIDGSKVAPGDKLCASKLYNPGKGCYVRGASVYACAVGTVKFTESKDGKGEASVILEEGRQYASALVLNVGDIVLAKVNRIQVNMANIEIVAAEGIGALREHHSGIIRKEDIRVAATVEVNIYDSFRPGDIVRAKVISLGDSRKYILSTAENDLGVIRAVCASSGEIMANSRK